MMVSFTASRDGWMAGGAGKRDKGRPLCRRSSGDTLRDPLTRRRTRVQDSFQGSVRARTGNFIDHGASYTGALQILKVILSYDYLWQNIRVKGGAYGCMSSFNRIGEGYLVSYRDPHLKRTMDVYEGVVDYLKNFAVSDRDMNKYIIGTISNLDQP